MFNLFVRLNILYYILRSIKNVGKSFFDDSKNLNLILKSKTSL